MKASQLLVCLLSALTLALSRAVSDAECWPVRSVPVLLDTHTSSLRPSAFRARSLAEPRAVCGIECQRHLPEPSLAQLEQLLAYETMYENGSRTLTRVSLLDGDAPVSRTTANASHPGGPAHSRRRRQVYGTDSRFVISDKRYTANYPFSTTVKVSTGCSGVLLSPRHVLTAAHCLHDGRDYVDGARRLRVGILKQRSKRDKGRRGRGQGGRKRGGDKGDKGDGRRGKSRKGRSVEDSGAAFRWTRVKRSHVPAGWLRGAAAQGPAQVAAQVPAQAAAQVPAQVAVDYDYALLELKRPNKQKYMDLGIVPSVKTLPAGRIHFSGFDDDRADQLVYRFCSVSDESRELLYQHCDAQPGSSGSGVYVRLKEPGGKKWRRKIIGVFSGHHWVDVDGQQKDYNVAVRITPPKYAQICHWIHGNGAACQQP